MPNRIASRQQVRRAFVGTMLCLIGAVSFAGLAQAKTSVKGTWQEGAPRKQSFKRVLVVGVSPHVNQRCAFEFFLASQIKSESVVAIRSCDAVKEKNPLNLESIEYAVAAAQADAVVATNLVSRSYEIKEGGDRDTRGMAMYKATDSWFATGYYGVYGMPVIAGEFNTAAAINTAQGQVNVESRVFATNGKTLLYTMDTHATKLESTDAALHDIAAAIAGQLHKAGLTR